MSIKISSCLSILTIRLVALLLAISFAVVNIAAAVEVECPVIADTMFSGHSSEHNTNCGARTHLRVKGYQGIVVFRFDMSKLEMSKVEEAIFEVFCVSISGSAASPLTLLDLEISTIAHDWIEGTGNYTVSADSSTYDYPGGDLGKKWGKNDNDGEGRNGIQITVQDVIGGLGDSILNSQIEEVTFEVGKWTEITLDPELVQGMVDGEQYGIVVWQPDVGKNLDLSSREEADGAHAAKLIVDASGAAVEVSDKVASTWGELKSLR